ncbi:hypothetical protein ACH5RR_015706 [Cinchona calisaya]|uniref:Uncharacterized protein n=1 Tax=Cinchona calisaya TaxID=153742 RepID=A0ABD2ZXH7_9GENT
MAKKRTRAARTMETFDHLLFVAQAMFNNHNRDFFEVKITRHDWVRCIIEIQSGVLSLICEFYANAISGVNRFVNVRGVQYDTCVEVTVAPHIPSNGKLLRKMEKEYKKHHRPVQLALRRYEKGSSSQQFDLPILLTELREMMRYFSRGMLKLDVM